jgi:hypothetical protein
MDFVYICRRGNNEELRYSIRSVVKNFANATIWIVGEAPPWYEGNLVYVPQSADKYTNAQKSMETIVNSSEIPEQFVLMNDDFYIMKKINSIDYFHGGRLKEKCEDYARRNPRSTYTKRLFSTYKTLKRVGVPDPLDYELHVPMFMEKSKLRKAISYGVLWRSVYGNVHRVGGDQISDVKVYFDQIKNPESFNYKSRDVTYLSTEDRTFIMVKKDVLTKKFSKPSQYEKPGSWNDTPRCPTCGNSI